MMTGKIKQTRLAILNKKEEGPGSAEYNRRPSTQDKTIQDNQPVLMVFGIMSILENEDTTKEISICLINHTELTCASSVLSSINRWRNVLVIVEVLDIFVQSVRDRDYVILRRFRME